MTQYPHNIAMLVPESLWAEGGAIIACISGEPADLMQFGSVKYSPSYDACNAQATQAHVEALRAVASGTYPVLRPDFDTDEAIDMGAVREALASAQYVLDGIPEGGITPFGKIVIGLDVGATSLAAAMGLTKVTDNA